MLEAHCEFLLSSSNVAKLPVYTVKVEMFAWNLISWNFAVLKKSQNLILTKVPIQYLSSYILICSTANFNSRQHVVVLKMQTLIPVNLNGFIVYPDISAPKLIL